MAAYDNEFSVESWGNTSGQPMGLKFESQGVAMVCDAAHQAIFRVSRVESEDGTQRQEIEPYVREMLYFTDSGPFGETSLQNPRGSVFAISP